MSINRLIKTETGGAGKVVLYLVGAVAALFVVVVILTLFGVINHLSIVTYDNGKGSSFKLMFDTLHTTKTAPANPLSDQISPRTGDHKDLVALKGQNGEAPLELSMTAQTLDAAGLQTVAKYHSGCPAGLTPVMTVHNTNLNQTVPICALRVSGKDYIDLVVLSDPARGQFYTVLVMQDSDVLAKAESSGATAQESLAKAQSLIGLETYRADLTKIIGSIQPLD